MEKITARREGIMSKPEDKERSDDFEEMAAYAAVGKALMSVDQFDFSETQEFIEKEHPRDELEHDLDDENEIEQIITSTENTPDTSAKESNEIDIQMKSDKRAVRFEKDEDQ
jgi:hypothetical protein